LSVVIPAYNEERTIAETIERVKSVNLGGLDIEIVVVDDGSKDRTREILKTIHGIRVVLHERNSGKGAAVKSGFRAATGDIVLIQDADLEYDPEDWPRLIAPVLKGRAKVVYGSRITGERRNMLYLHWVGNKLLSLATNLLYNTTLSDMETCYKLFDREVLRGITIKSDRFDFEPEITAKVLRQHIRIYEVPISYAGREFEEGKKITWRDGFAALYALFKFRVVK
jgi:glycosyltransferase involved in cell wall biosynthesis